MKVEDTHIEYIEKALIDEGLLLEDLRSDMVDHICCLLEQNENESFEIAYTEVMKTFKANEFKEIEKEIINIKFNNHIIMKKFTYLSGYIATTLTTTGILFKIMHWPGANIMIIVGIFLLNFIFLPTYFYKKYKVAQS